MQMDEVGLVAIAFGPDAQPEKLESTTNVCRQSGRFRRQFDCRMNKPCCIGSIATVPTVENCPCVLHRLNPEVRVISKQVLSLGDERVVLGVNFVAEISRAGLFPIELSRCPKDWKSSHSRAQHCIIGPSSAKAISGKSFSTSTARPLGRRAFRLPFQARHRRTPETGRFRVRIEQKRLGRPVS